MSWPLEDAIAALGSAPGAAGRGVIRATGARVASLLEGWFLPDDVPRWNAARGPARHEGRLTCRRVRQPLPTVVQRWPTGRSYTGQPLWELHLPGSPPLLEAVLAELYERGVRPAKPGEFTLRAFLAGKLDLMQAEAVLGVIDAHDQHSLRMALEQLAGGISHQLVQLRSELLNLLADLEAGLDFVEEHLEFVSRAMLHARLASARSLVERLSEQAAGRMHTTARARVVLAGLPNAGKSTLFNALANRDAALVSPVAGTTRDFLEACVDWHGVAFELVDTAGWESTQIDCSESRSAPRATNAYPLPAANPPSDIAFAAQELRSDQLRRAALIVWCTAANATVAELADDAARRDMASLLGTPLLVVQTKADVKRGDFETAAADPSGSDARSVSAHTGHGLNELRTAIGHALRNRAGSSVSWLGTTAARCEESVQATQLALQRAEDLAGDPATGDELIAVELREALEHLGRIVGAVYTDDLLDRIFSRFCIGK